MGSGSLECIHIDQRELIDLGRDLLLGEHIGSHGGHIEDHAAAAHDLPKGFIDIDGPEGVDVEDLLPIGHVGRYARSVDDGLHIALRRGISRQLLHRLEVAGVAGAGLRLHADPREFFQRVFQLGRGAPHENDLLVLAHQLGGLQSHSAAAACDDTDVCHLNCSFLSSQVIVFP